MEKEKVIVWGSGAFGKRFLWRLKNEKTIVAYADSDQKKWGSRIDELVDILIMPPDKAIKLEHDRMLIAISSERAYFEVCDFLKKSRYDISKVVNLFSSSEYLYLFMNQRFYFIKDFAEYVIANDIPGNVAECGVFQGESAKIINHFFCGEDGNRSLYLFDTFEGFAENDLKYENKLNNPEFVNGIFNSSEGFKNTSIEYVMGKMQYPLQTIIMKGYFPESAKNIDDNFVFVNLDMDLYQPMLAGLRFFWPKLQSAGCILLHDYFRCDLPGVKKALDDFEYELGKRIPKIPIGDGCSIAVVK